MQDPNAIVAQAKAGGIPPTWRVLRPTKGYPAKAALFGGFIALIVVLASCGLGIQQPIGGSSSSSSGPRATLTAFCGALHDGNYSQAYSYFSDHYKATITDPSQVPHVFGTAGTVSDCKEFGNGGFLHINGTQADDSATFVLTPPPFNGQALPTEEDPATVNFVESGSTWQIDSIAA